MKVQRIRKNYSEHMKDYDYKKTIWWTHEHIRDWVHKKQQQFDEKHQDGNQWWEKMREVGGIRDS